MERKKYTPPYKMVSEGLNTWGVVDSKGKKVLTEESYAVASSLEFNLNNPDHFEPTETYEIAGNIRNAIKEAPIIAGVIERKDMARKRVLGRITGNNNDEKIMMSSMDPPLVIGSIFYASWGYDQTNIDYFQVVGISSTGKSVRLRPIKDIRTPGPPLSMEGTVMPLKDQFDGPEKRYKYHPRKKYEGGGSSEPHVKIESYMYAYLWDGNPKGYTSYA